MWKQALLATSIALAAVPAVSRAGDKTCSIDVCKSENPSCRAFNGKKWCDVTHSGGTHYTRVNVYDHTGFPEVPRAWANLNNPPNPPGNTLFLKSDGQNHSNHDLDYWKVHDGNDSWLGLTETVADNGCMRHGSGKILFNLDRVSPDNHALVLIVAQHETGHGVGLGHVCDCPNIMNACVNCKTTDLSACDATGLHELYP